ncbi:MAG: hypothetical protein HGB14_13560 [Anaerolineaceae bacterium]|nr:hypothetical protein [Anaerolineaceae bacterium]
MEKLEIISLIDEFSDGYGVENLIPASDLFMNTAAQLGLPPFKCVVVEDAAAGIGAAMADRFRSIGLGLMERVGEVDLVYPSLNEAPLQQILAELG